MFDRIAGQLLVCSKASVKARIDGQGRLCGQSRAKREQERYEAKNLTQGFLRGNITLAKELKTLGMIQRKRLSLWSLFDRPCYSVRLSLMPMAPRTCVGFEGESYLIGGDQTTSVSLKVGLDTWGTKRLPAGHLCLEGFKQGANVQSIGYPKEYMTKQLSECA